MINNNCNVSDKIPPREVSKFRGLTVPYFAAAFKLLASLNLKRYFRLVEGTAGGTGSVAADASGRGGSGGDWYSAREAW